MKKDEESSIRGKKEMIREEIMRGVEQKGKGRRRSGGGHYQNKLGCLSFNSLRRVETL